MARRRRRLQPDQLQRGRDEFEKTGVYVLVGTSDDSILLTIYVGEGDPVKTGYEDAKGFVVLKGSQLVKPETNTIYQYMSTLRKDLLAQGVILDAFAQDQVFTSPSTAAGVVLARAANGRIEWKNSEGKTLKQLQAAAADEEPNIH